MTPVLARWRTVLTWVLIPVAALFVYFPAISGGLIMDDAEHITPPALQSVAGLGRIWFEVGATPHYYPVLNSAFWLENRLWGASPLGYHLVNVVQHAFAACLLVLVVRRLGLRGSFLAGLIFALHPVHVESVAWISEQKNTLSMLFGLGATLAYLRFRETGGGKAYALASALFVLALLAKTVVAVIPPALLVLAWWQRGRLEWRRDVLPLVPWFAVGAVLGLFSAWFERVHSHAQGDVFQLSWIERALIAGRAVCFYVRTLVWPSDLMFINPRWTVDVGDPLAYAGLAAVVAVVAGLIVAVRWSRSPLAICLLFVGMLFPTLGFLNINWFNFSYVANHFQYLPSLAIIVPCAVALDALQSRFTPGVASLAATPALIVVLSLGWLARTHAEDYRTPQTLYANTLARNPACWLAHNNLGVLLLDEPGRLEEATRHFERALALRPEHARAHNNYGTALVRANRVPEALAAYRRSLELQEAVPEVHFNYGQALVLTGTRNAEAIAAFDRAIQLRPDYLDARVARAAALARSPDRAAEAVAACRGALAMVPDRAELHLALATVLAGFPETLNEGIAHYREAIRLDPRLAEAYNNLATVLAENSATQAEAVQLLTQATRIAPDYADAHFNLGALLAGIPARRQEAIDELRNAARLKPDDPEVHTFLASILAQASSTLEEAAMHLQKVILLRPDSAQAHVNLAMLLARIPGRSGESAEHFRQALILEPSNRAAQEALANPR